MGIMEFTSEQIERYSRHILVPEIGGEGQKKILKSKVFVVGAGGLGSPCAFYLAAAGVGKIAIADSDKVDLSNLQRQIIHNSKDLNRPKATSAKEKIELLNPDVEAVAIDARLTSANVLSLISEYDVVVDGSDNFPTRYLMNDACVLADKPLVHAGILRFDGQAMTILPKKGPCYRCLFPEPPPPGLMPSCQEAGILGAIAGVMGTVQAVEALKLILGKGDVLSGRLLVLDALKMKFREVKVHKNPDCPICGEHPSIKKLIDYEEFCGIKK